VDNTDDKEDPSKLNESASKTKEELEEEENKLQEELEEKEIQKLSKPFFLGKLFVRFPWVVVILCWLIVAVFVGITIALGLFEMTDQGKRDYLVWSDYRVKRRDRLVLAQEDMDRELIGDSQEQRSFTPDEWFTNLFYKCDDCEDVFTAEIIKKIYEAE